MKELKSLKRSELIEIIYQLKKNEQKLRDEIADLSNKLEDKSIRIDEAGSVADAAISISKVFAAAQEAADIYLEEIKRRRDDLDNECLLIKEEAEKQAADLIREAMRQRDIITEQSKKSREELKKFRTIIQNLEGEADLDI